MRNLLLILLGSICIATILPAQSVKLTEDFNNGLQNVWYPSFPDINNITAVQNNNAPSGDGWIGRLDNSVGGGVGAVLTGSPEYDEFYFEAKIFVSMDVATYYGIEFRLDSTASSSGYNFLIRPKGGFVSERIRFRNRVGTSPTVIKDWVKSEVPGFPTTDGWHKLGVYAKADSFWLYYDDQLLPGSPIIDNSYSKGFVGLYYWDMSVTDSVMMVDDIIVRDKMITSIERPALEIPKSGFLSQNYPNPFNPTTIIEYELNRRSNVNLTIYSINGSVVKTLVNGFENSGMHKVQWDGTDLNGSKVAAGIYPYTIRTQNWSETKKMILLK